MSAGGAGPSRGGGRGRGGGGRGRGGGRGGRGGGMMSALPMGVLTWNDVTEMDKAKPNRHAYPPIEAKPVLHKATEREMRTIRNQLNFVRAQQDTPWWPLTGNEIILAGKDEKTAKANDKDEKVTSSSLKRGSAHIPRYSDKFRRVGFDPSTSVAVNGDHGAGTKKGKSSQSTAADQKTSLLDTLQREAFPVNLWRSYVTGENRRQERKQEASSAANRKSKGDWKRIVEGVEMTGGDDVASDGLPSEEEEEGIEDQDEYEDDVEDDYADNYFDNGEDDDVGDADGGADADVYD